MSSISTVVDERGTETQVVLVETVAIRQREVVMVVDLRLEKMGRKREVVVVWEEPLRAMEELERMAWERVMEEEAMSQLERELRKISKCDDGGIIVPMAADSRGNTYR